MVQSSPNRLPMEGLYTEGPACPACRSPDGRFLTPALPDRFAPHRRYRIARCRSCRLAFTEGPSESYPADYEPFVAFEPAAPRTRGTRGAILRVFYGAGGSILERAMLWVPSIIFRLRDRMKVRARDLYARPFRCRGRLLDVGSGGGDTLKSWVPQQDEVVGVEPDAAAARAARDRLGLDVRTGRLEDQDFAPGSFDGITLCHVLEHLEDPQGTLARAAALLKPGGEMIVWVPSFDSPLRGVFGTAWFPYEVPRHRWHFRPSDVVGLLRRAGLCVVEVVPDASESSFRKSARASASWARGLLRRRSVRLVVLFLCRLFRRADAIRLRARKPR